MPETATTIINRVRQLLITLEGLNKTFRNGFSTETDPSLVPILPIVNDFLSIASLTGIRSQYVNLNWPANSTEISVPTTFAGVLAVYYQGRPLRQTTRQALDENDPGWDVLGTPTAYFREGSLLTINRFFAQDTTLRVRAALQLTPFVTTDPVQEIDEAIPDNVAQRFAYGPAYLFAIMDAGNELNMKRVGAWQQMAEGVLAELSGATDKEDYMAPSSFRDYKAIPTMAPSVRAKLPVMSNPATQ